MKIDQAACTLWYYSAGQNQYVQCGTVLDNTRWKSDLDYFIDHEHTIPIFKPDYLTLFVDCKQSMRSVLKRMFVSGKTIPFAVNIPLTPKKVVCFRSLIKQLNGNRLILIPIGTVMNRKKIPQKPPLAHRRGT